MSLLIKKVCINLIINFVIGSVSKEKSSSIKEFLEASLSYNVSEEEDFEASKLKNSSSLRKKNNDDDIDDFKKFYDEMNKKLLSYK